MTTNPGSLSPQRYAATTFNGAIKPLRRFGALGEPGSNVFPDTCLMTVLDDDAELRISAALILGELKEQAPVGPLLAALDDEESFVGRGAAQALEAFGMAVPVEALLPHLADDDAKVARAVAKRGHPAGIDVLNTCAVLLGEPVGGGTSARRAWRPRAGFRVDSSLW